MKASLVYDVDGKRYVLESCYLDFLDQLTFRNFKSEEDIFEFPRYKDMLANVSREGKFSISISYEELTVESAQLLWVFGRNPYDEEQLFDVIYNSQDNRERVLNSKKYVIGMLGNRPMFDEFYEKTIQFYTPQEKLFHEFGVFNDNPQMATECVIRFLKEFICGRNHYDMCRIMIDGLSKFDAYRQEDEDENSSDGPNNIQKVRK